MFFSSLMELKLNFFFIIFLSSTQLLVVISTCFCYAKLSNSSSSFNRQRYQSARPTLMGVVVISPNVYIIVNYIRGKRIKTSVKSNWIDSKRYVGNKACFPYFIDSAVCCRYSDAWQRLKELVVPNRICSSRWYWGLNWRSLHYTKIWIIICRSGVASWRRIFTPAD